MNRIKTYKLFESHKEIIDKLKINFLPMYDLMIASRCIFTIGGGDDITIKVDNIDDDIYIVNEFMDCLYRCLKMSDLKLDNCTYYFLDMHRYADISSFEKLEIDINRYATVMKSIIIKLNY